MKARLAIVAGLVAALTMIPLGGTAGACPDPDNPCTPPTYDPISEIYCLIKSC